MTLYNAPAWRLRDHETRGLPTELRALPPGLLSSLAAYVFQSARRPSAAAALAESLAIITAACGSGFSVEGQGLSLAVVALAPLEFGLEVGAATRALAAACVSLEPVAADLLLTRGPAHRGALAEARAAGGAVALWPQPSGWFRVRREPGPLSRLSGMLVEPGCAVLATDDPTRWRRLSDRQAANPSRTAFIGIAHDGPRPPLNRQPVTEPPPHVVAGLAALIRMRRQPVNVRVAPVAATRLRAYARHLSVESEAGDLRADVHRQSLDKVRTLVALVAISRDPYDPVIGQREVDWAIDLVQRDADAIIAASTPVERKVLSAEIARQIEHVRRKVFEYRYLNPNLSKSSPLCKPRMQAVGHMPMHYLTSRLLGNRKFKRDPIGATAALERAIQVLVEEGVLRPATEAECAAVSSKARAYRVCKH